MSKELSNRIEELRTLGWSEEGASKYAEKLLNGTSLDISFTTNQILIGIIAFSSILIFTLILIVKRSNSQRRNDDLFNLIDQEKVDNNIHSDSSSDQKNESRETFNSNRDAVPINFNTRSESIGENKKNNGINSQLNFYKSNELQDDIINNSNIIKDSTKKTFSLNSISKSQNISKPIPKNLVKEYKIIIANSSRIVSLEEKITLLNKNKIKYLKYFIRFFKETTIDINRLIEHFLLIILLSFEALLNLLHYFSSNRPFNDKKIIEKPDKKLINIQLEKPNESKNISFEERKKVLMNKTNSELRSLLKTQPNLARLRKSELVKRILILEFGSLLDTISVNKAT